MNFFKKKTQGTEETNPAKSEEVKALLPDVFQDLSDAGLFSYVALCALTLLDLFPEEKTFNIDCIKKVASHLQQRQQVESTGVALVEGKGNADCGPFIERIKEELHKKELATSHVLQDLVTIALKEYEGVYDARYRVFIKRMATLLEVDWAEVETFEKTVVALLKSSEHELTEEEKKEKEDKSKMRKIKRIAIISAATIGGGTLLGLTGGLAAPFLAAGLGTIIGGAGAAALGTTVGVAIIGSLFGVAGAGLGGYKMNKRIGDVEEFAFDPLVDTDDLHVTIAITGWLTEADPEVHIPWKNLNHSGEQFVLRFETKYLLEIGNGMNYILEAAVKTAANEALKYTVLAGIMAAITWPATILAMGSIIDNPWSVSTHRAAASGKQLAEVLLTRQQGKRPVTLVGYSLGARVIYYCLLELSSRRNCEGIIQDAVMLGSPVTGSAKEWMKFKKVVAGRIVNGFFSGDWLLKFLYRTASVQIKIAGLAPINWKDRRMINLDLTHVVTGHLDYKNKLDEILTMAGIRIVETEAAEEVSAEGGCGSSPTSESDKPVKAILSPKDAAQPRTEGAVQSDAKLTADLKEDDVEASPEEVQPAIVFNANVSSGECAANVSTEGTASKQNAEDSEANLSLPVEACIAKDNTDTLHEASSVSDSMSSETHEDRDTLSEVSSLDHDVQNPHNNNDEETKFAGAAHSNSNRDSNAMVLDSPDSVLSEESLDSGLCSQNSTFTGS